MAKIVRNFDVSVRGCRAQAITASRFSADQGDGRCCLTNSLPLPEKSRTEAIDLAVKSTATMAFPKPGPQTQA